MQEMLTFYGNRARRVFPSVLELLGATIGDHRCYHSNTYGHLHFSSINSVMCIQFADMEL